MKLYFALIITSWFLLSCSEKKDQAPLIQELPVQAISKGSTTTYQSFPASLEGIVNIEIRPQVSGILNKTYVDDGAYTSKGEELFRIETAPFTQKLNMAIANYKSLKAALDRSQIEIDKLTPLVANQVVSGYQLKTAVATRESAVANLEQAKAEIAEARINLGYTLIKSPASGYIGRLLRKQGSLVSPADPSPLAELSDVHNVHAFFAMGEGEFILFKTLYKGATLEEKIQQLPPVELVMADESIYPVKGRIDVINGQFDKNTGAITFRATFANKDKTLRSGNTGKIRLGFKYDSQLLVPQSATLEMQDQIFVFSVDKQNKVWKKLINILGKTATDYIIKSEGRHGLNEGDRIVSTGFDHLHEGDLIKPIITVNKSIPKK